MARLITAHRDDRGRIRVPCPWTRSDLLVAVACHHCPKFSGDLGEDELVVCSHVDVSLDDVRRDLSLPETIEDEDGEVIRLG